MGKKLGNTYNQRNCAFIKRIKTEYIDVYQDKKHIFCWLIPVHHMLFCYMCISLNKKITCFVIQGMTQYLHKPRRVTYMSSTIPLVVTSHYLQIIISLTCFMLLSLENKHICIQ